MSAAALLLLALAAPPQEPALRAALFDELELLHPDTPVAQGSRQLRSEVPRGAVAAVHLLVEGLHPARPLRFRAEPLGAATPLAGWARLHAVPVEENTGLGSRTEQFEGVENPHVARRAPFEVYEAVEPLDGVPLQPDGASLALRLEVRFPRGAAPGLRAWSVELDDGRGTQRLRWEVVVHAAAVPPSGAATMAYTNWYSPTEMATRHGLEPWSEAHWAMIGRYAALMAHGRQNVFWIRSGDVFGLDEAGAPVFRRARFERFVHTFRSAGLHFIEGSPLARRPGGDWSSPWLELGPTGARATGPEGRAQLAALLGGLRRCLDENGWTDAYLQHLADEPTDTNATDYRALAGIVREHLPGVPIVEATMSRELAGAVDVWCPQVQKYQQHRDFFEQRRAAGDRLWTYTCLVPGGPWLNRLLDQERLRPVWIGWAGARFGIEGFLHWGLNHYKTEDPLRRSVVDHPAQPGTSNKLPAGDTHVVYPGPGGPWSGLRFEAHRIGLEDRELLEQLRARDPARLGALLDRTVRGYDDWEREVPAYRAARRELLEALSAPPPPASGSPPGAR